MSFNMTGNLDMATTLEGPSPFNGLRQLVLKCKFAHESYAPFHTCNGTWRLQARLSHFLQEMTCR